MWNLVVNCNLQMFKRLLICCCCFCLSEICSLSGFFKLSDKNYQIEYYFTTIPYMQIAADIIGPIQPPIFPPLISEIQPVFKMQMRYLQGENKTFLNWSCDSEPNHWTPNTDLIRSLRSPLCPQHFSQCLAYKCQKLI